MPDPTNATRPRHFIIAGMPRAGTTYLYHAFAAHPGAFVPYRKELRYFSTNYHRGPGWYERFFSGAATNLLRVDASPDYFMDPATPARIRAYSPSVRVVLAIRNPADWAVSLHRQLSTIERSVPAFDDFLRAAEYPDFGFSRDRTKPRLGFSIQSGFVRQQMAAFREALGPRLMLFDFASFERDPLDVMRAIESFLGLGAHFAPDNLPGGRINARTRMSNRWLSYIFSRDALVNAAGKVLPRKLLVACRLKVDRASVTQQIAGPSAVDASDFAAAREALTQDIAYVHDLFAESTCVFGDGQPFR